MIVIPGIVLVVIAVVYLGVSVLLLSLLWDDLDKDTSRVMFLLFSPLVILGGFLAAMSNATPVINKVKMAIEKRVPGNRLQAFIQRVRRRGWGQMTMIRSLQREIEYRESRLDSQEAGENHRAHRLAEGVLNNHWLDATVKVREALSQVLTDACRIASEKADKAESEAMEALRIRAETAERMLALSVVPDQRQVDEDAARKRFFAEEVVHGRTPGGEQGLESTKDRSD